MQLLTSFKVAYYQTPYLSVAKYTIRKLYNYQQFITAYENLLHSEGVTNSNRSVSTKNITGEILSKDALGVTGDKVWIFVKSGKGLSTVQMINMIGINASCIMKRVMWTIKHRMLKKISQFVLAYQEKQLKRLLKLQINSI